MYLKTLGIVLTVFMLQACSTKKNANLETQIMWVSGYKTECDAGAGKKQCLIVSKTTDLAEAKWEYFYNNIDGFNFEDGLLQKIEVKVEEMNINKIAVDRSSLKYSLLKVLEKKEDNRMDLQGEWILNKLNGANLATGADMMHVKIDLNKNQFSGNNGCNSFSGVINNVTFDKLTFDNVTSTLRDCMDTPIPDEFDAAVKNIDRHKVNNNTLTFYNVEKKELLSFTKKQTSAAVMRIHDIYVAVKINGEPISRRDEMPRLELNLNTMEVFGNNGCNPFNGKITSVSETDIAFGGMAMTRKTCQDMILPGKFDGALQKTVGYKFEDLHLTFFDKDGKELVVFLKVD